MSLPAPLISLEPPSICRRLKLLEPQSSVSRKQWNIPRDVSAGSFIFAAVLTVSFCLAGCSKKNTAAAKPPPPEVQVMTITAKDVPVYDEWIGTLDGAVNAQIRAQVTGYLANQNYNEGARVKKGDVLFEIDPRPFQAALDQAQGKLAQDHAMQGKTELDVKRFTPLARDQAVSQEELDDAVQANIAAEAQIKADEAAAEIARVNLGFTKIYSPVDGIAGLATGQIGDLVGPSGGPLTTVSTIDPIRVYFQVSEQQYAKYWHRFAGLGTNGDGQQPPSLQLVFSDGAVYPIAGRFFFADRQVNINTGTIQITGLFPNPDYELRPGQYGRIRAQTRVAHNVFLIPQRAVTELQGYYQVDVVDSSNIVHLTTVTVSDQIGSDWIVEKGLQNDDRIVVEGLQKVKEKDEVKPTPYIAPAAGSSSTAKAASP
jgi:RND family efflux transporter MFP subunit